MNRKIMKALQVKKYLVNFRNKVKIDIYMCVYIYIYIFVLRKGFCLLKKEKKKKGVLSLIQLFIYFLS